MNQLPVDTVDIVGILCRFTAFGETFRICVSLIALTHVFMKVPFSNVSNCRKFLGQRFLFCCHILEHILKNEVLFDFL